jgi:hypothetical protein
MKYLIYIYSFVLIILILSYYNSLQNVENFTPKIREIYRPIFRKTRIISEGFYNKTTSNIYNLLRKFEIM